MHITVESVLRDCSRNQKVVVSYGLLTQVNYSENCTFGTLKGQSLNTGGLNDRSDCTCTVCHQN